MSTREADAIAVKAFVFAEFEQALNRPREGGGDDAHRLVGLSQAPTTIPMHGVVKYHGEHRAFCDHCDWDSPPDVSFAAVQRDLTAHLASASHASALTTAATSGAGGEALRAGPSPTRQEAGLPT